MKISCLPCSLFADVISGRESVFSVMEKIKETGYDYVDLSVMLLPQRNTPAFCELKGHAGEICMLTSYPDFTHPDKEVRSRELEYSCADIAAANELCVKYLRVTPGQAHPDMPVQKGTELVLDYFYKLSGIAKNYGVTLLFENHSKPGAWEYSDFSHPTKIFLDIARGLRGSGIRINFDTVNTLIYGDDPLPVLEEIYDMIETVHVADSMTAGKMTPAIVGCGVAPIKEIFSHLRKHGFDGMLCVEEASGKGYDGLAPAYRFTIDTWNSLT